MTSIFLLHDYSVHILFNLRTKKLSDGKKDIGKSVHKTVTLGFNYDRENAYTNALRPRRFK